MSRNANEDFSLQFTDDMAALSAHDLLALSGLQMQELVALVEQGAFGMDLHGTMVEEWRFQGRTARLVRRAVSLRRDFELEESATSLLLGLLERIDDLQRRVRELECRGLFDE